MNVKSLYKTGEETVRSFHRLIIGSKELKMSYTTDKNTLTAFHEGIIQQCFDKDDVSSVEELIYEVQSGDGVAILVMEGSEILGGVVVSHYWSTGKKIMLVSWLGVDEKHRGRNIGSLLIEEVLSYARANGALILLGEIENPDHFPETKAAYGNPFKRVKFYSRFDCKRMEVPCYIPAFTDEQEPIFGVMLTLFPLSAEQTIMTEIYLPELAVFVDELVGQDMDEESRAFVEACENTITLTSFRELY